MVHVQKFKGFNNINSILVDIKLFENIIDIKDFKNEFLEKWKLEKPNNLNKLNVFFKKLNFPNNTKVKVSNMNVAMIEQGNDSLAEFVPNHYPSINLYLNYRDIKELKNLEETIKNRIMIMIGHELLHYYQWKKGTYFINTDPLTDKFQKLFNKCSNQLEQFRTFNENDKENFVIHLFEKTSDYELMAWSYTIIQRLLVYYKNNIEKVGEFLKGPDIKNIESIENLESIKFFFEYEWPKELQKKKNKFKNYCYHYLNIEGQLNSNSSYKQQMNKIINENFKYLKNFLEK